jgi:glycosyltransferase involved in cell wall biosynthesis
MKRVVWLDSLKPREYLALLAAGDVMVDPFPFGGGVTTLESLAVCTPVVTSPALQSVPGLAAGMLRFLASKIPSSSSSYSSGAEILNGLVPTTVDEYISKVLQLLDPQSSLLADIRTSVCSVKDELFSNDDAVDDWSNFLGRI